MSALQEVDSIEWRERMIVGIADRMPHEGGLTVSGKEVARSLGLLESLSWLEALRLELGTKNWAYIVWDNDDLDDVGFELYGEGLLEAAKIRRRLASGSNETGNASATPQITIHNSPVFNNSNVAPSTNEMEAHRLAKSGARAGWLGTWGTWAGVIVALLGLYLAFLQFSKD